MANNHKFVAHKVHLRMRICCSKRSSKHMQLFSSWNLIQSNVSRKNSHLTSSAKMFARERPTDLQQILDSEKHTGATTIESLSQRTNLKFITKFISFYSLNSRGKNSFSSSTNSVDVVFISFESQNRKKLSSQTFHIKCRCKSSLFDYVLL
jgi:hypothetical protein